MVDDYPEHKIQFYFLEIRIARADVLFFAEMRIKVLDANTNAYTNP